MIDSIVALPKMDDQSFIGRSESQLLVEAAKAKAFSKPFVAAIFESLSRVLPHAATLRTLLEKWPGNLADAAAIFRLNAGLHALALSGQDSTLAQIYADAGNGRLPSVARLDSALAAALARHASALMRWMAWPTQTNEVARTAGLVATLLELDSCDPIPTDLLEVGASAGLNLNLSQYGYVLGRACWGDPDSVVRIAPEWRGRSPAQSCPMIASARGIDLHPLDVTCAEDVERLRAYVWAGEHGRSERLCNAVALARAAPPVVERGRASHWVAKELSEPQRPGLRRVVFHSMVVQYMPLAERATMEASIALAGAAADASRPLVRVGLEWSQDRSAVELRVTLWDGSASSGQSILAATCHPYAEWFDWHGLPRRMS